MLGEDAVIDGLQGVHTREADGKDTEVPLESWVDGEAACGGVHAGHILDVVDLLQGELVSVVPASIQAQGYVTYINCTYVRTLYTYVHMCI